MTISSCRPSALHRQHLRTDESQVTLADARAGRVTCQVPHSRLQSCCFNASDTVPMRRSRLRPHAESRPLFLAGHPALDFLNTRMRVNGELVDCLRRDEDVLRWLKQAGLPVAKIRPHTAPISLV